MPTKDPIVEAGDEGAGFMDGLHDRFTCGVVTVDSERRFITLTPQAESIFGWCSTSNQTPGFADLPEPVQSLIEEVQEGGHRVADRQILLNNGGNAPVAAEVTALPMVPGRRNGGVVLLVKDRALTQKLEYNLRRLDRLASFGTLSASMAHEIKNALVPVRTFVELLLEKHPDAELAETVGREMRRVDTIVSRMLRFAAPAKPQFSEVRLHEILEHSLRLVQHRVEGKSISFRQQFNLSSDVLSGDDHQLEQAFVNLMLNAVEAMGAEGTLSVSTGLIPDPARPALREGEIPSKLLCVRISDTGPGIPIEHQSSVFEPFFTTKPNGTGLGLAVTARIIEEHNGIIRIESQPGLGTTFTLFLPAPASPVRPTTA